MRSEKELAAAVRAAMKKQKLEKHQLAEKLKISPIMLDKLLCGDIFPSRHLEKQMTEILGIKEQRVAELARRRERKTPRKSSSRKAA